MVGARATQLAIALVVILSQEGSSFLTASHRSSSLLSGVHIRRLATRVDMAKGSKRVKKRGGNTGSSGSLTKDIPSTTIHSGDEEGGSEGGENDSIPRLIVMDLDYTLWNPELYQMRGSPFTKTPDGKVRDRSGTVIDLFKGVREILLSVHRDERFSGTRLAIASRTEHASWAREVMSLLELEPGVPMSSVFPVSLSEIYRGSKVRHFGELRKNSGVPYENMIFFDDWDQNCKEVGRLGVTCIECRRGLNEHVWSRGLESFAAKKKSIRT